MTARKNAITSVRITHEPDTATQRGFGTYVLAEAQRRGLDVRGLAPAHTTDSAHPGAQQAEATRPA